jgi:hypothetical protein
MTIEELKLTARLKNKTWNNPQIQNHKQIHELILLRQQTQHKSSEHMYLKLLILLTQAVEKIVNLFHGFR